MTIKQAIFPDFPRESPVLDKNGNFSPLWDLGLSSLFQALQVNFKDEGLVLPPLTATQMSTIQALYTPYVGGSYNDLSFKLPDISGQTVYDSTTSITNQFVIARDSSTPPNVILANWVPLSVLLTNAGNPNYAVGPPIVGAVPGVLNWLCYDTSGMNLYICTTAGSTGTVPVSSPLPAAVWTLLT